MGAAFQVVLGNRPGKTQQKAVGGGVCVIRFLDTRGKALRESKGFSRFQAAGFVGQKSPVAAVFRGKEQKLMFAARVLRVEAGFPHAAVVENRESSGGQKRRQFAHAVVVYRARAAV